MIDNVRGAKKESVACEKMPLVKKEIPINVAKFILGAAGIVFGAEFLVDSATELAVVSGVSQAVISATIVAIGTSLPELVTTVTAIVKNSRLCPSETLSAPISSISRLSFPSVPLSPPTAWPPARRTSISIFPSASDCWRLAIVPMLIRKKFF